MTGPSDCSSNALSPCDVRSTLHRLSNLQTSSTLCKLSRGTLGISYCFLTRVQTPATRVKDRIISHTHPTMPPRLNLFTARSVAFRTRPSIPHKPFASSLLQQRAASDNASSKQPATTPVDSDFKGPNMDQLPHVSEEQAALDKSMGNTPPDIDQGTPVQEVSRTAGTYATRPDTTNTGVSVCRSSNATRMHKKRRQRY